MRQRHGMRKCCWKIAMTDCLNATKFVKNKITAKHNQVNAIKGGLPAFRVIQFI